MTYQLGIDIGSTVTTAAIVSATDHPAPVLVHFPGVGIALPSLVTAEIDGRLLTGPQAQQRSLALPGRSVGELLLRMGDPTPISLGGVQYSTAALLAEVLSSVIAAAVEDFGSAPGHVVMSHPGGWGPYRREQFAEVPRLAGVTSVALVPTPQLVAGRLSRYTELPEDALVLVCDWGAHTFECSVQQHVGGGWREIGAPDGVERLGGADVDEALFTLLDLRCAGALTRLRGGNEKERQLAAEVLDRCREGKEALSAVPATVVEVPLPGELHRELVTRSDVEGITEPLLEPALAAVARCLQSAGISAGDLHTVVLVGGSGQAPVLTRMLTRALERPVHLPSRPGAETALAAAEWGPACPESAGVEAPALQRDVVTLPPEEDDHAGEFEEDPPRLVELVVAGAGPHTATGSVAAFPSQVHVAPTGLPTSRDGSTRWEDHGERPRSAPQEPTDPARSADPSRSTDTDYHPDPAQPAHSAHPRDSAHPSTAGHPSSAGHSRTAGRPGGSTPARQQVRRALPHPRNWSRPLLTSLVVGVVAVSATALVLAAALHGDDRTRTTAADPGSTPAGTVLRRARTVNPTPPTPLPTVTAVTTGNSLSPATPAAPLTLPVSTLPTGQVQLCAQGNYSAYLLIPQPASGGVAMPSVASPVVAPGQCWMAQVPTGGQSVQISLFARRGDGVDIPLGSQVYSDVSGVGFGAEGAIEGPFVWRW